MFQKSRTAIFTRLVICDCSEESNSTSALIQWPAALTAVELSSSSAHTGIFLSYPFIESRLMIHKETLSHITIGINSWDGCDRVFRANLFPNLEFLRLARWHGGRVLLFTAEDANILGPRLRTFSWGCFEASQAAYSHGFGKWEASWLRQLAELAIAQDATLKTIIVDFYPLCYLDDEYGPPWSLLHEIQDQVLRPSGRDLRYNWPVVSRERYQRHHRAELFNDSENEDVENENVENDFAGRSENPTSYHGASIRGFLVPNHGTWRA